MTTTNCFIGSALGLILFAATPHSSEPAEDSNGWSKEVRGLSGRLIADTRKDHVRLSVELKNNSSLPYWVTTHDPFAFDLVVKAAGGKLIATDAERADITCSPQAAIVPRECQLSLPVSLDQKGQWNLDIVTKLWALKPGKYLLTGQYRISGEAAEPKLQGKAYLWTGTLDLPEIEVEIR